MNYLLDKKIKKKKFFYIVFFVIALLILFYFRLSIYNSLAFISHTIFRPVLIFDNNIGGKLAGVRSYFVSKNSLYLENENLKSQLGENGRMMINYNSILDENIYLKGILGRKNEKPMTLSAILTKPNQSPYDTLIIDAGIKQGLQAGDLVFASGNVPIGRVSIVYPSSSKVILFSNSGEKTQVIVSLGRSPTGELGEPGEAGKLDSPDTSQGGNVFMEVVGRGGGNFEMILPRDFTVLKGDEVVLPGIFPYVLGIVETIISDPRDPFIKALLVSPVNIQELKFVEVEK